MKQYLFIMSSLLLCLAVCTGISMADAQKGPAEIILKSTLDPAKKAKRAFFPHEKHQKRFDCGTCHHAQSDDGQQVAYKEGQKIAKCESCHNTKSGIDKKLETFKKAAHARCRACHKKRKKEGKEAGPIKCKGCHRKNIQ